MFLATAPLDREAERKFYMLGQMWKFPRAYLDPFSRVYIEMTIGAFGSVYGYYYPPQYSFTGTNIYIRGLASSMNDNDLYGIVAQYGNILSCKAIIDLKTGVCKGYGFAMFENSMQAQAAMDGLSNQGFNVSFAVASPRDQTVILL